MKQAQFIRDPCRGVHSLSEAALDEDVVGYYISSRNNPKIVQQFERKGYINGLAESHSAGEGWKFVEAYCDLIDHLAKKNDSLFWWTSELATRNHFFTQTPYQVHLLVRIADLIQYNPRIKLILIGIDASLELCLRELLIEQGVSVVGSNRWLKWRVMKESIQINLAGIATLLSKVVLLILRVLTVKTLLGVTRRKRFWGVGKHVVIKTFVLPSNINDEGVFQDSYFQPLIEHLLRKDRAILLLAHINRGFLKSVWRLRKNKQLDIVPYEAFVSLQTIVLMSLKACFYRPKIGSVKICGFEVARLLENDFSKERVSVSHLAFYSVAKRLSATVKIERFIMTYENRAWENACILGLRQSQEKFPIVGYQHAVVLPAATSYFLGIYERQHKPLPDRILTVGRVTCDMLLERGRYPRNLVKSGCALRMPVDQDMPPRQLLRDRGIILLALEGVPQASQLLAYCLRQFRGESGRTLIIRTHPEMPIRKFNRQLQTSISKSRLVALSENRSLSEDLEEADICIYWGSTVSLHAAALGLPLVNFVPPALATYDPLFEICALKWQVHMSSNLQKVIDEIYRLGAEQYREQCSEMRLYLQNYFKPITIERLDRFIS